MLSIHTCFGILAAGTYTRMEYECPPVGGRLVQAGLGLLHFCPCCVPCREQRTCRDPTSQAPLVPHWFFSHKGNAANISKGNIAQDQDCHGSAGPQYAGIRGKGLFLTSPSCRICVTLMVQQRLNCAWTASISALLTCSFAAARAMRTVDVGGCVFPSARGIVDVVESSWIVLYCY